MVSSYAVFGIVWLWCPFSTFSRIYMVPLWIIPSLFLIYTILYIGTIPAAIGSLAYMTYFSMSGGKMTGESFITL